MKLKKKYELYKGMQLFSLAYRYFLGLFGFTFLLGLTNTFASEGSSAFSNQAGSFGGAICSLVAIAGDIVGGLAVTMVLAAGVIYAVSGSSDKGDLGIGTAKNMIASAIAGVALYILGGSLLGTCGQEGYGNLLRMLLG